MMMKKHTPKSPFSKGDLGESACKKKLEFYDSSPSKRKSHGAFSVSRGMSAARFRYKVQQSLFIAAILLTSFILLPASLFAQTYSTTIHKTDQFSQLNNSQNELRVYNINGSVTVEGYDGNKIEVMAEEKIKGNNNQVSRGKSELHLKVEHFGNQVVVYVDAPFTELTRHNGHFDYEIHRHSWNGNGDNNYHFRFDIHVKVPRKAMVHASTINKGTVYVKNTTGSVFASNINGDVNLAHISGKTEANNINGDITVKYDQSPDNNSQFHTINGDINAYFPADLSAKIKFKSMHGDLYTNFNDLTHLAGKSHSHKNGGKTYFQIGQNTLIRVGNGGPTYQFKVLNGDVYIKKNRNYSAIMTR